tara:strand:+ start:124 stop:294 length:171 start_codon:yes stop_codon:yes gene_type:complete
LLVIKFNELKAKDLKVYKAGVERINLLTEHLDIKNQVRSNNGAVSLHFEPGLGIIP